MIWRPELFRPDSALIRAGEEWLWFPEVTEYRSANTPEEAQEVLDWAAEGPAFGVVEFEAAHLFEAALPKNDAGLIMARTPDPERFMELAAPPVGLCGPAWNRGIAREDYLAQVAAIRESIEAGRVYQVNLTWPLHAEAPADLRYLAELLCLLCEALPPPYAALVSLRGTAYLSLSPELFFRMEGDRITCKPMKGTRGPASSQTLERSPKDRAENLMIVDMIRNDLGKIATPGSVRVTELFNVDHYPTVTQMTSTIEATAPGASLADVFGALFPCASVVGAPKIEAMRVIQELESAPRGVYCGSIGYSLPGEGAQFNVAIRTATIRDGKWQYGVGSGVVWDSTPEEEWDECLVKTGALEANTVDFELLETMRATPGKGYRFLEEHLARMGQSAQELGFPWDPEAAKNALSAQEFGSEGRVRLLMARSGEFRTQATQLIAWSEPLRGRLCPYPVDSTSPWLRHKTTHRECYVRARANVLDVDKVLLWNERGELCEWDTGNLVVQIGQSMLTPPLESGCLPGIFRQHLLDQGQISEKTLLLQDLERATHLWHINSVRGWTRVEMFKEPSETTTPTKS